MYHHQHATAHEEGPSDAAAQLAQQHNTLQQQQQQSAATVLPPPRNNNTNTSAASDAATTTTTTVPSISPPRITISAHLNPAATPRNISTGSNAGSVAGDAHFTHHSFDSTANNNSINVNVFINSRSLSPSSSTRSAAGHVISSSGILFNSIVSNSSNAMDAQEASREGQGRSATPTSISLTLPRPDHQRSANLYVDTPFPHRPTPRRPPNSTTISPPNSLTTNTLAGSNLNVRSVSPANLVRSSSPSNFSTFHLHSSSTNLLQNQQHSSTLPSVHRTNVKRSFVNPNSPSVNNIVNNSTTSNNNNSSNNNSNSNRRNNKLSSSSFSFSTSKNHRVVNSSGIIIQTQPTALSFTKTGFNVGSKHGSGGGNTVNGEELGIDGKGVELNKSSVVADLRGSDRRPVGYLGNASVEESIICSTCGRCRCEACRTPKPPPSAWLCSGKCLCSASSAVDCITCAWCVKACLYHCGGEDASHRPSQSLGLRACGNSTNSDQDSTREMSSCWQNKSRCAIWTCLILGAIPLPCLLCYFPLTGLRRVLERGYQRCTNHGCRCTSAPPRATDTPSPVPSPGSSVLATVHQQHHIA